MLTARSDPVSFWGLMLAVKSSLGREALMLAGARREGLQQLENSSHRGGYGSLGIVQEVAPRVGAHVATNLTEGLLVSEALSGAKGR